MSSNKNLLKAVFAIAIFILFWDWFVVSRFAPPKPRPSATPSRDIALPQDTIIAKEDPKKLNIPVIKGPLNPKEEKLVEIKNENVRVAFSSKGARVVHWQIQEVTHTVELVNTQAVVLPLETFPNLNFNLTKTDEHTILFQAIHPDGFEITKVFSLKDNPFRPKLTISFNNVNKDPVLVQTQLSWGLGLNKEIVGTPRDEKQIPQILAEMRAVAYANKVLAWQPGLIFNRSIDRIEKGAFEWFGVDNDHFIAAFLNSQAPFEQIHIKVDKKTPPFIGWPLAFSLQPNMTHDISVELFVGPKILDVLKTQGHHLEKALNFGAFGFIAKGLLWILNFFHDLTGNYGWAIVLLTIFVQIVFFPLTRKSLRFSGKMKELQPQLKKVQEQFSKDPKRMQLETFNLYKRHGIRFMGMEGCFPILIQIPIFLAFYQSLRVAYELRGASWLWINDLAAYDPTYVLPILMGAGMFLQQKMTSVAMDPAQAKIMLVMPILFTFLFLKLPSGLVLYWVVNSLTTILIQKVLQWKSHPKPSPTSTSG